MHTIYSVLTDLHIPYEMYEHPAVFTVEEAKKYYANREGVHNKSIFLRNKKGTKHYLVVMLGSKRLDIKSLQAQLREEKLSFASPERLKQYLGLTPGSVSPFGLINDIQHEVEVIVDEDLMKLKTQGYHPNTNTATLTISTADFKKFLEWTGNKVIYKNL